VSESTDYLLAKTVLRGEKAMFRLANLCAHGYEIQIVLPNYVILTKADRSHSDILILADGRSFTRCLG